MSPTSINAPATPNLQMPSGMHPNFSIPPPRIDTDIRIVQGIQSQQTPLHYLNGSAVRPLNGTSNDMVQSDGPPGVF